MVSAYFLWCGSYAYDADSTISYLEKNAMTRSHNCCAWYVMRAMHKGGCPTIILPAFAYERYLPLMGWKEVKPDSYRKGDVVVFPKTRNHPFGHIAMWSGSQWISDFKQRGIIVSKDYKEYRIYRFGDDGPVR